ncbi:TPA: hypothetical protein PXM28_002734 [Yersinia enterocolitica]|nr:hypothetical protein [Yersinia enterocolitica]
MGKQSPAGKGSKGKQGVTWAHAWRDVMLKAMASGQLVPITISIILMIAAFRLPEDELSKIAHDVIDGLISHALIGWVCAAIILGAWSWHAGVMRRCFSQEAQRIGREKTEIQQNQTSQELGTSDK